MTTTFLGTELKLNIHIEPMGKMTMDDYDFSVELYCSTRKIITVPKSELRRVSADNYIVTFDTRDVGIGMLKCNIIALIPDSDFADAVRTEVVKCETGITIKSEI